MALLTLLTRQKSMSVNIPMKNFYLYILMKLLRVLQWDSKNTNHTVTLYFYRHNDQWSYYQNNSAGKSVSNI